MILRNNNKINKYYLFFLSYISSKNRMFLINSLKRYLISDMDGIIGKINQHCNTFEINLNNIPPGNSIISTTLLNKLEVEPQSFSKGSIGYIYISMYNNNKIAIKIISPEIKDKVYNDVKSTNFIGNLKSNISEIGKEISHTILNELNMIKEHENCHLLHNESNHLFYDVKFLQPIEELCTKNEFVYYYEDAISLLEMKNHLNIEDRHKVAKKIVLFYFDCLHNRDILLGDININNILYQIETEKIIILDYGNITKINQNKKLLIEELHNSQISAERLTKIIKKWNGSKQIFELLFNQSRPFFDLSQKKYHFNQIKTEINIFDYQIYNLQIPSEIIWVIRASSQLIQVLKSLDIYDNYSKDLMDLINYK